MFLSTFARNLVEVFIPIILYKFGYDLWTVMFYFFLVNFISLLISYPCALFSIYYILAISFLYAVYRRFYWMSRRYFNLNVIKNKDISKIYSIISIINQIGVIISAYCGSLFLDFVSLKLLTILVTILFFISLGVVQNLFRTLVMLICLIPGLNIKMMIYLTLTLMTISGFFTLKNKKEIYEEN